MNESRIELKVGIFVAVGLALAALLILNFSKGITLFKSTYNLHVIMPTVAGLKPTADVMMSGVPIGKVTESELRPDGRSVNITLNILGKYKIRKDAVFHIDALGFLGDQYVAVSPPAETALSLTNDNSFFKDGDTVQGEEPFNMQEAVRSISGLLDEGKKTMGDLDQAITNVNRTVLSAGTLGNFGIAISNFQSMSETAVGVVRTAQALLNTNMPPINHAVENFEVFSEKLKGMADELDATIQTNRGEVTETVRNLRDTSLRFKQLAEDLQAGKGVAGGLLKDDAMRAEMASFLSNADYVAANFSAFGSNLNQRGLWSILWKPKHGETNGERELPTPRREK